MTGAPDNQGGDGGTAWRRIADALAASIEQGEYEPGDTLPASVALAERYGVHRHTVRQAFRHLAERGLVTVSRGRGTQVTAPRFPYKLGRRVSMRTNFGAAGIASEAISWVRDSCVFDFKGSPAEFVDVFRQYYGPTMNAFEAARRDGRDQALRDELVALFESQNQSQYPNTTLIAATFLKVTVEVG